MEDSVERLAQKITKDALEKGECDFVVDVAAQLPLLVICEMMGVPSDRVDFVFDKSNTILGAGDVEYTPEGTDVLGAIMGAAWELAALMREMLEERRVKPTEDLTSALLYAELEGEKLTEEEIASFFILLLVAGNETTRNALSWGLHLLTENPEQKEILWNDFENLAPKAVEEIVRWASPVIFMRRTVTRDGVRLGDREFEEGDKLSLYYWAANRDPSVFENPHQFNILRDSNDHFGYGLREIQRTIPGIFATEQPDRLMSGFINGIKHLHCTW